MKNFLNFKFLVIFSVVLIIGILLPFHHAEAWIQALASNIVFTLIAVVLEMIVTLTSIILLICVTILNIVTSPNFIVLPYTSGGIVDIGWPIVRDLANLGFTLALVFIGLATALQIEEYGFKKALPRLLAMALLINFTPVIAGIIVDASNIIMNFFLTAIGDFNLLINLVSANSSSLLDRLRDFLTKSIALNLIAESVVLAVFNILAGFFFLLYAFLFIVRYVAIWALVIVSPLAFFANVFPKTQSYYKQWWHQFIQWCFVGVPASFFLYLSWHLLNKIDSIIVPPPPSAWVGVIDAGGFMSTMLSYSVVLVFLFLGFISSLSSGAMGATAIISTAKGLGKSAVGNWKKGTGAIGQAKQLRNRGGQAIIGSNSVGTISNDMAKNKNPIISAMGLKGKEIRGNLQKSLESVKDGRIDAILSARDSDGANAYLSNPLVSELNKIKLAEGMAEKWDEEDRMKVREGVGLTTQASMAASWGLANVARKMVKDSPSLARVKAVSDINIDPKNINDPKKAILKDDLERIRTRLAGIRTKLNSGMDINNLSHFSAEEQAMADEMRGSVAAKDFFQANDFSKPIEDIIEERGESYYAIAGELGLERTMAGMKGDSITGLSNDSLNSKRIRQLAALQWTSNKFDNVFQSRGPGVFKEFITGIDDIGTLELAKKNPKLGNAAYSGMLTDRFNKRYAAELNGQPTSTLIETAKQWDQYISYVNGGSRPKWMKGTPPPSGGGSEDKTRGSGGGGGGGTGGGTIGRPSATPPAQPPKKRQEDKTLGERETEGKEFLEKHTAQWDSERLDEKMAQDAANLAARPTPGEFHTAQKEYETQKYEKARNDTKAGQGEGSYEGMKGTGRISQESLDQTIAHQEAQRVQKDYGQERERASQGATPKTPEEKEQQQNEAQKIYDNTKQEDKTLERRKEEGREFLEKQAKQRDREQGILSPIDVKFGGQNGSIVGAIPCTIQGRLGADKPIPFEIYKDPLSGFARIRKTDDKNSDILTVTDDKTGKSSIRVKNDDGVIINEDMSFRIGRTSYRLSGNKFIIGK